MYFTNPIKWRFQDWFATAPIKTWLLSVTGPDNIPNWHSMCLLFDRQTWRAGYARQELRTLHGRLISPLEIGSVFADWISWLGHSKYLICLPSTWFCLMISVGQPWFTKYLHQFSWRLYLSHLVKKWTLPSIYCMCEQRMRMRRLAWAFVFRLYDQYPVTWAGSFVLHFAS